ncbi:MAG: 50S ribosomal protein L9 [Candidatus Hydrogenedentes bacterium]|nr:50S ribosomal protein L9 [Candidatus Hydrogenedentota bacterium]
MKVILCEDVPNLGKMGASVKVADGYARNYLLPRKLAVNADSASAKQIEHEMQIIRRREEKLRTAMTEFAKKLESLTVEIKARAGEEDKLFGSVTNAMIAEKLAELGVEIERKQIALDEPIRALGIFTVPVRLGHGIEAGLKVWVTAIVEEEPVA